MGQSQESLTDQLRQLIGIANDLGLPFGFFKQPDYIKWTAPVIPY